MNPRYQIPGGQRFLSLALFIVLSLAPLPALADIVLGSWNIKHLGWNNDKDFTKVAHLVNHFDFLAIQELMNKAVLERLEQEVETLSGESWSSMASHALGRSTYREHYAFLWRDSAVEYMDGAVVFIDGGDTFAREPYSARFRSLHSGQEFVAATVHVVYGSSVGDRLPEITALADYWTWLSEVYPGTPRLLMGDFNLAPNHAAWRALKKRGVISAITQGATTLGTADGHYANLYDNIWRVAGELNVSGSGIVAFPPLLGIDHASARSAVSDHAPIYLTFGNAKLVLHPFQPNAFDTPLVAANEAEFCIDLNTSNAGALQTLPHIGPVRAQDIINGRPWMSAEQLERISGIGKSRLRSILNSSLLCKTG